MAAVYDLLEKDTPLTVGSLGDALSLKDAALFSTLAACDLAEIRLDLLLAEAEQASTALWAHLAGVPLIFTARRQEEGGALALSPAERMSLLRTALDDAAFVDVEVASIGEMAGLLAEISERGIPWIASYHDFEKLPPNAALEHAARLAKEAGAAVFKSAARLNNPADLARLAEFQLSDHGLPVATMGMGPLAAVSRLLCAQSGSVLNYGYLGATVTAPGQWDSHFLKSAIARLVSIRA